MTDINNVTGNICDVATGVCQSVTLSLKSVPFDVVFTGVDFKVSAGYFAAAFIPTLSLWLVAKCSGMIVAPLRNM
ncbi:TPA: hypothetical protein G8R26_002717 [Salmonella enterica]|uniref:Uncharacterized protein n=1 Tax=Salmonella enterica TaxID=28901 RepID=A0A749WMU9_SALER|nr:hypothetical protein [Salmonella enterica subsp. enterica serovar Lattenkamp]ECC7209144.1 hypothetical protein [Salmonella enterica]EDI2547185.1 hypothetical protein [Salmonella enterica subsp. enterica serovar Koketime]EDS3899535.1 hypothetical protein [Salmonella enterica subsp. enterica]EHX6292735.1 hypothetical protein [Salmonella enterica subsp. enterica serovar Larochelle]